MDTHGDDDAKEQMHFRGSCVVPLVLALGGFCFAYTFVCFTNISFMSFLNVTLKKSNAVAMLGIMMAGPTGLSNEVAGSVELLVQEMAGESLVGSVSSRETLVDLLVWLSHVGRQSYRPSW